MGSAAATSRTRNIQSFEDLHTSQHDNCNDSSLGRAPDLHQVEREQDSVIVIRVRKHKLVLILRLQEILESQDRRVALLGVPDRRPCDNDSAVEGRIGLTICQVNSLETQRLALQQSSLIFSPQKVIGLLRQYAVNKHITDCRLPIQVAALIRGKVDRDVERHPWETLLERLFEAILLVRRVAAVPACNDTAFGQSCLIDFANAALLNLWPLVETEELVVRLSMSDDAYSSCDEKVWKRIMQLRDFVSAGTVRMR